MDLKNLDVDLRTRIGVFETARKRPRRDANETRD